MGEIADDIIDSVLLGEDQYDGYGGPPPDCPYCGERSVHMTETERYGREFSGHGLYVCVQCDASIGCHPDGRPLGTLANKELRELRRACHITVDQLWKSRSMTRRGAYRLLAAKTGVRHIGETDEGDCRRVLREFGVLVEEGTVKYDAPESETYKHNGRDHERGGAPYRRP